MARYFFNVVDATTEFGDHEGEDLPNLEAAKARAVTIAQELAGDADHYRGFTVIVVDGQGNELARIPVPVSPK
jgi:hypothetical protein